MNKIAVFGLGCLAVITLVIVVFGGTIVAGHNALVRSTISVDTAWVQGQTQYQRRADLIPDLVRTVEGAANFEKSTLTDVINARASATKVAIDPSKAPTDPTRLQQFQKAQHVSPVRLDES